MNNLLADTVTEILTELWGKGHAPTRKAIVEFIKTHHPELYYYRLDLDIGTILTRLVDTKILQRTQGKYYNPGPRLLPEPLGGRSVN